MPIMASAIARGTVRAVSRTSPLGTSAHSMPANAKISSSDVRATSPAAGIAAICRFSALTKNAPPTATSSSGSSLATVAIELSRTPSVTPRRLTSDQNANAATRTAIVASRSGQRRHEQTEARRKHRRHRRGGERAEHPQQHAGEESGVGPERRADVGVRPAGQRHAAAGIGDAQHDQPHRDRADQVGDRRRGAERAGDVGRQAEDAAADRDVDDAGGQAERADGADQRFARR